MHIAIVGSRKYPFPAHVRDAVYSTAIDAVIVSGGARGVDTWAEEHAKKISRTTLIIRPNWSLGKHAALLRNEEIVRQSDIVYAFWDGESRGTRHVANFAEKNGKAVYVWTCCNGEFLGAWDTWTGALNAVAEHKGISKLLV